MKTKEAYAILTKCTNTKTKDVEIKISQEAYSTLEKAQNFISSRDDYLYKIDEFNFETSDPYHFGFVYLYTIVPIIII